MSLAFAIIMDFNNGLRYFGSIGDKNTYLLPLLLPPTDTTSSDTTPRKPEASLKCDN
jgi:hypothetical protein